MWAENSRGRIEQTGRPCRRWWASLAIMALLAIPQVSQAADVWSEWYQPWPGDYTLLWARGKTVDNPYAKSRHLSYFDLQNRANQTVRFVLTLTGDDGVPHQWDFSLQPGSDYEFSIDAGRIVKLTIGQVRYGN